MRVVTDSGKLFIIFNVEDLNCQLLILCIYKISFYKLMKVNHLSLLTFTDSPFEVDVIE